MATKIEWTDETWNPIVGCSVVSPGCTNCYAMKMAARLEAMALKPHGQGNPALVHYEGTTKSSRGGAVWTGKVALAPEATLTQPLRWRRPRRIFVNSMGDLFHESVPDEWIDSVFAVMALAPQHTFQVLTKRSKRMHEYLTDDDLDTRISVALGNMLDGPWIWNEGAKLRSRIERAISAFLGAPDDDGEGFPDAPMPLPNVWLGVSTEDQARADERIPDLIATPAAVRFISAEPLLGQIELKRRLDHGPTESEHWDYLLGTYQHFDDDHYRSAKHPRLDWVIAGGESGAGSRPMHPGWARSIRDQCTAAGVPFLFKQWGEWTVALDRERDDPDWRRDYQGAFRNGGNTQWLNLAGGQGLHGEHFHVMRRVGKNRAGRLLDGVEHNDFPEARA